MKSENKKPTKKEERAKSAKKPKIKTFGTEKTVSANKPHPKAAAKAKPNSWSNFFDSSLNKDVPEGMQNFMNGFNSSFCGVNPKDTQTLSTAKDMMSNLSHNMRHNFEQNMELGQEILKCKTASDFIEFQRKNFELNYKGTVKLCSELFHDMQSLATQNLKNTSNYVNKEK